jgi:prohibitin 2
MKRIFPVLLALFAIFNITGCSTTVDPGYVGVGVEWGNVEDEVLPAGFHWISPFLAVEEVNIQVQATDAKASATTNDLQNVSTTVTLNWARDPSKVVYQYENYPDIEAKIIAPAIQESVKAVTAHYDASQLVTERGEVKTKIMELISERLTPIGITVDTLNITDFAFSDQFNASIERKVEAEQKALQAEEELRTAQAEAKKAIATAEGAKQAAILKAEGEAEALNIKGQALRSNPGVLELERVKAWNGVMPQTLITDGNSTLLIGSGGN